MSLEDRVSELTEAIKENSNLLREILAAGKARAAEGKALAEEKASKARVAEKDEDPAPKAASKRKTEGKGKALTVVDARKMSGIFMRVDDEEERERRKAVIAKLLDDYEARTVTDLPE